MQQFCSGAYRLMACSSASLAQLKPVGWPQTITKALGKPLLCTRSILQDNSVHIVFCLPAASVQYILHTLHPCMTTNSKWLQVACISIETLQARHLSHVFSFRCSSSNTKAKVPPLPVISNDGRHDGDVRSL